MKMKNFFSREIFLSDRFLIIFAVFYLVFPIILFAVGWLKFTIAILVIIILILSFFKTINNEVFVELRITHKIIYILSITLLLAFLWVLLSGIGGFGLQSWDFNGRNAILHDLINHSWPVKYDYTNQPEMASLFGSNAYLAYYFSFFLPSAIVGKVLGWSAANVVLFVWSWMGVILTILLVFRYIKKYPFLFL